MVICTMECSLTGDTRHENLTNIKLETSGLVIYPGYQQSQQFHPNICISHDENPSRSESPSDSSGSGSEKCKQTVPWEATKVKILISAYTTKKI